MLRRLRYPFVALTVVSASVALSVASAVAAPPAQVGVVLPGDVNGDGQVTIVDVQLALRAAVGQAADLTNASAADLAPNPSTGGYGDGKIAVADVVAILRLAVGLDSPAKYSAGAAGGGEDKGPTDGPTDGPTGPPVTLPAVQFGIDLPRGSFAPSDPIPFTVRLVNGTDKEVSWDFANSCQVDLQAFDDAGNAVWQPTDKCLQVLTRLTLKPGEGKDWKLVWEAPSGRDAARRPGTYTAKAVLNGTQYGASITFQVKEVTEPVPLPSDGPPTFSLTPGHADHYANLTRGSDEDTIRYLRYVKAGGQDYTAVSLVPDGARDVLLRLDADNNLWQRTGDIESIRLKLDAKVGDTWTFDFGSQAQVKLVSRDAELKTPGGIYTGLLQFDFFVGPDFGWTEWVHPKGFWVGYTRETIAGPVDFRLTNRDAIGFAASSGTAYSAVLYPDYIQVAPGEQAQLNLIVADSTGTPIRDLPRPVRWIVDPTIGTVDANGLFTAKAGIDGIKGSVEADVVLIDRNVTAHGTIVVGTAPGPGVPKEGERLAYLEGGSLQLSQLINGARLDAVLADIAGSMPDPSWSYDRTDIQIDGDQIRLYPILRQTPGVVAPAVITPFTATVEIKGLATGHTYTVIAAGADTKLIQTIRT